MSKKTGLKPLPGKGAAGTKSPASRYDSFDRCVCACGPPNRSGEHACCCVASTRSRLLCCIIMCAIPVFQNLLLLRLNRCFRLVHLMQPAVLRDRFMAEDSMDLDSEDISISGSSMSDTPPSSRYGPECIWCLLVSYFIYLSYINCQMNVCRQIVNLSSKMVCDVYVYKYVYISIYIYIYIYICIYIYISIYIYIYIYI